MKSLSTSSNAMVPRAVARAALAACSVLVAMPSVGHAEDTPLSLTLSQNLRRDSNLLRSTNARSDTVSTTAVQGNFNKAYGRQVYSASARFARVRYDEFNRLDNDAKDLRLGVTSQFASNWQTSLNANSTTSLVAPQDNPLNNRALRNIRNVRGVNGSIQYGNGGTWAVQGTFDNNRISFSEDVFQFQNSQQNSQGLRLIYNATDLLNFGFGPRWVRTRYPNNSTIGEAKDKNLDFTVNWRVTGLSSLNALLSARESEQGLTGSRRINTVTGSLGWGYTPRGRISYGLNLTRATNADRFQDVQALSLFGNSLRSVQNVALDTITTSLNLSASAAITGKISTGLSYGFTRFEQNSARDRSTTNVAVVDQLLGNNASSSSSSSSLQSLSWSTNYAAYRWLGVNCALQFYKQSADVSRPRYDGHSVDCGANFTIDP
ncbi:hypothetical protein [Aquabacterium commune]|nr:hypothetical protein [Aquabacterium commune]